MRRSIPCRIILRLRISLDIGIGVQPKHIPLHRIRRQEHPYLWVIIPRVVVIQPRQRVIVLSREAFGGVHRAFLIGGLAIGSKDLVARDSCTAGGGADRGHDTAQSIGQLDVGGAATEHPQVVASQRVVILVGLDGAAAAVGVLLYSKGVDGDGRARAVGRTPQHPLPRGVRDVPFLVGCARIPFGEVIQDVVRERGRGATERAAGHVAKGVIAAGVDLSALTRIGCTQGVEPIQLVGGAAGAVEVLVLRAAPIERALPELAQVGGDITRAVGRPTQAVGERARATGAVACSWLRAAVASPHQPLY